MRRGVLPNDATKLSVRDRVRVVTSRTRGFVAYLRPDLLRVAAIMWLPAATVALIVHLWGETAVGLTAGDGSLAFGDDTINFWAAARLATAGRITEVYDFAKFHDFQTEVLGGPIHLYHYSYPPTAILVSLPLAFLPYLAAWAVWLTGGWVAFFAALRAAWPMGSRRNSDAALSALAAPAILANAVTGQNGTWMAALLGGGLVLMERRPRLAGVLCGLLLVVKPQLGLLIPVALIAGRRWVVLAATTASAAVMALATLLLFGLEPWEAYAARISILRQWILEDGTGVWTLMTSVFVMVRHLSAPLSASYAVQGIAAVVAAVVVVRSWQANGSQAGKNAVLVIGTLLATPYLQVYDLVVASFVPLWLLAGLPTSDPRRSAALLGSAALIAAPFISPAVAKLTGFSIGCLLFIPLFVIAVRRAFDGSDAVRHEGRAGVLLRQTTV